MYVSSGKARNAPARKPARLSADDRKQPALKYLDRFDGPDDRPRQPLQAYTFDPGRSKAFTGETVGNSHHNAGPTNTKRHAGCRAVSTLTDHVTLNEAKWLPSEGPVSNPRKGERTPEYYAARNRMRAMTPARDKAPDYFA
jgi:hypothetical protein